jgi:hypothetical protein
MIRPSVLLIFGMVAVILALVLYRRKDRVSRSIALALAICAGLLALWAYMS